MPPDEEDFGQTGFVSEEELARRGSVKGRAPKEFREPIVRLAERLGIDTESADAFRVFEQRRAGDYQINIEGRRINATVLASSLGETFADEHPDISVTPDVAARVLERLFEASGRRTVTEYVDIGYVLAQSAHDLLTDRGLYAPGERALDQEEQQKAVEHKEATLKKKKGQLKTLLGITDFSEGGLETFLEGIKEFRATQAYQQHDLATPDAIAQLRRELKDSQNPSVESLLGVIESAAEERQFRIKASRHGITKRGREVDNERIVVFTVPDDERDLFLTQMDLLADGLEKREDVRNAVGTAAAIQGLIPVDRANSPEASVTVDYMGSCDPVVKIYDIPAARAEQYKQVLLQHGITTAPSEGKKGAVLSFFVPEQVEQRAALVEGFARAFPRRSPDEPIADGDTRLGLGESRPPRRGKEAEPDRTQVDPPAQPPKKRWWQFGGGGPDADAGNKR